MGKLQCRICGNENIKLLGQIPDCGEFAGQHISPPIKGGELWICNNCDSMFRHPTLAASDYIALYERAAGTVWTNIKEERNDFATVYKYLNTHISGSILDVGCYTGDFLAGLPDKFNKYGIEPSNQASMIAASRGIIILGNTLDKLDSNQKFDVVVSIDVIEHVLDVEMFLNQTLTHVKKNGLLVISTGNPGNFFWKNVFKSKYWYNQFAEHVTFPGYRFYFGFSKRLGLEPPEQIRFRYTQLKPAMRLSILLRILFSLTIYNIFGSAAGRIYPIIYKSPIGIFNDHHVLIFKNRGRR